MEVWLEFGLVVVGGTEPRSSTVRITRSELIYHHVIAFSNFQSITRTIGDTMNFEVSVFQIEMSLFTHYQPLSSRFRQLSKELLIRIESDRTAWSKRGLSIRNILVYVESNLKMLYYQFAINVGGGTRLGLRGSLSSREKNTSPSTALDCPRRSLYHIAFWLH